MTKRKKEYIVEEVFNDEVIEEVKETKSNAECYTFIRTVHDWLDIIKAGQKLMLTPDEVALFGSAVTPTKAIKWSTDCGCK